jgi:transposase-like protein
MGEAVAVEQRISVETTPYFYGHREALALLRRVRWPNGLNCPRCGSTNIREVETSRVLEALSCRDCQYNFTTVADSYFHGSRIPIFQHFQFIAAVALEPESSASRLGRFFGFKPTTVGRQLTRLNGVKRGEFVRRGDTYQTFENFTSVASYLEQPAISFSLEMFEAHLRQLLAPRGRTLRRTTQSTRAPKVAPTPAIPIKFASPAKRSLLVSPSSLPYLYENDAAYDLVDSLRWGNDKRACPRCNSGFVVPVKRAQHRDLYRCVDCQYIFGSLSGTIFQGAKMPLNKFFQFFILYDALGEGLKIHDVIYVLECTYKTATLWLERSQAFKSPEHFAFVNQRLSAGARKARSVIDVSNDRFFAYCDAMGIVLNEANFLEYTKGICQSNTG